MGKRSKKNKKRKSGKLGVSRNVDFERGVFDDAEPDLTLDPPFGTGDDDLGRVDTNY